MILPKDFCLISIKLHIYTVVQKNFSFKKFLWKRRMHFWLACWNSCCQKLHYVIAQYPELIIKVWLLQKCCASQFSSGHLEFSSESHAENVSPNLWHVFCSNLENGDKKSFCQLKSPRTFFWTSKLRFSTLSKVIHSKKREKAWEYGFFKKACFTSIFFRRHIKSKFDNPADCFSL